MAAERDGKPQDNDLVIETFELDEFKGKAIKRLVRVNRDLGDSVVTPIILEAILWLDGLDSTPEEKKEGNIE